MSVPRCALLLVLAAVAPLPACGSDRTGRSAAGGHDARALGGTSRAPATRPPTPVAIAPGRRRALRGHRVAGGKQAVAVRVAGTAAQQQIVRVDGHCAARSCVRMALADMTGHWSARLLLVLPRPARHASVTARYALGPASAHAARVRLVVEPPRAAPTRGGASGHSGADVTGPPAADDGGDGVAGARGVPPAVPSDGSAAAPAPPAAPPGHGTVVLIGDSLAVGLQGLLPAALPGWSVRIDGRTGRPLAEGLRVLAATDLPPHAPLAISLFTNDDPTHVAALRAAVRRTLARVGPDGCVVWATIQRPPHHGVSYGAANALLSRMAGADARLRLVRWAEAMRARPGLLRPDGVHPTPEGYALRARLYAAAIASC